MSLGYHKGWLGERGPTYHILLDQEDQSESNGSAFCFKDLYPLFYVVLSPKRWFQAEYSWAHSLCVKQKQ